MNMTPKGASYVQRTDFFKIFKIFETFSFFFQCMKGATVGLSYALELKWGKRALIPGHCESYTGSVQPLKRYDSEEFRHTGPLKSRLIILTF